jgi:hypothetical protein
MMDRRVDAVAAVEFKQVYDYDNLFRSAMVALKEKEYRHCKRKFYGKTGERIDDNLIVMQNELIRKTYRVKPVVKREKGGKCKLTASLSFRDRVIQIAVCSVLRSVFEKFYIGDNYAFRKGMGANAALERFGDFIRHRENKYYLKCRIKNLHETINATLLFRIIENRYIKDKEVLWLIKTIYEDRCPRMKGDWLSWLLANCFCAELDRYVKIDLQTPYYLRYRDEFIMLSDDYTELSCLLPAVERFLCHDLGLKLDDETTISRVKYGIWFLGQCVGKKAEIPF